MDKIKVLFIDDDVALGQLVSAALQEEGFDIHYQSSLLGVKAVVVELNPNVIVLDVEIGLYDGIAMAPELHQLVPGAPILFISSHTEWSEVVRGLATGAVTYLKKPIEIEELIAYIKRYATPFNPSLVRLASFGLDLSTRILYKDSQQIKKLSKLEFMLLKLLYEHKNKVVPREEIEKLLLLSDKKLEYSRILLIYRYLKYICHIGACLFAQRKIDRKGSRNVLIKLLCEFQIVYII